MRSDRGSVTMWMLGLSLLLLLLGGLAVDFWRALALQRALAAAADSAAVAAASGIDEEVYRLTGEVMLDPDRATQLATSSIQGQDVDPASQSVSVAPDGSQVSVEVADELVLGLLGVFVDQSAPLLIRARATAEPVLLP